MQFSHDIGSKVLQNGIKHIYTVINYKNCTPNHKCMKMGTHILMLIHPQPFTQNSKQYYK